MSVPFALEERPSVPLRRRLAARLAVAAARALIPLPPRRLRAALRLLRTGARPATTAQAAAARDAVVTVSTRCAGQHCLQRSLATALLCRMTGNWPTWRTGVRTSPFRAHAWVEADGQPIGEPHPAGYYTPTITIAPPRPPNTKDRHPENRDDGP
ncbi:lasso peptide biosynthesis B2 protein [Streptomyces sp. NPDC048172]|uniref:lasso peptide biosynthesis B2 protein n=1 Tax=Streptomyces sp. NPDC048172 TaxID=3365505 RepID=UPI00371ECB9D